MLLRQIEVAMGQGKSTQIPCREAGISEQSYYRWRKEYGGLQRRMPLAQIASSRHDGFGQRPAVRPREEMGK